MREVFLQEHHSYLNEKDFIGGTKSWRTAGGINQIWSNDRGKKFRARKNATTATTTEVAVGN